jgi:hypothetical protein
MAATPGDLLSPGDVMQGSLSSTDNEVYYGITLDVVGTYNLSVYSTDGSVEASIHQFQGGYGDMGSPILSETSNDSSLLLIYPGAYVQGHIGAGDYLVKIEIINKLRPRRDANRYNKNICTTGTLNPIPMVEV